MPHAISHLNIFEEKIILFNESYLCCIFMSCVVLKQKPCNTGAECLPQYNNVSEGRRYVGLDIA